MGKSIWILVVFASMHSLGFGEALDDFSQCLYDCGSANQDNPNRCIGVCMGTSNFSPSSAVAPRGFGATSSLSAYPGGIGSSQSGYYSGTMPNWSAACLQNPTNPLCAYDFSEPPPTCTLKVFQKFDYSPTGWAQSPRLSPASNGVGFYEFELEIKGNAFYADINGKEVSAKGGRSALPIPTTASVATVAGPGGQAQCKVQAGMAFFGEFLGDAAKQKCNKALADKFCQDLGWGPAEDFLTVTAGEFGWGNCTGPNPRRAGCIWIPMGSIPQSQHGNCSSINCLSPR